MRPVYKAIVALAATAVIWAVVDFFVPKTVKPTLPPATQRIVRAGAKYLGEPNGPVTVATFPVAAGIRAGKGFVVIWRHEDHCMGWVTAPGFDIGQLVQHSGLMVPVIRDTFISHCSGHAIGVNGHSVSEHHPGKVFWQREDGQHDIAIAVEVAPDGAAARIDVKPRPETDD